VTSPTIRGPLPAGVTPVGGIVLDLIGVNGRRVVSQVAASSLFVGRFDEGTPDDFRGNPGTIGVRLGFTPAVMAALGGGLAEAAIRLTIHDGDSAAGDFDFGDTILLLNGVPVGDFSDVPTEETSADGQTTLSTNLAGGFRNELFDTGFFHVTDPVVLADLFISVLERGSVTFQVFDVDTFDNVFDFTRGVSGDLTDVELPPGVDEPTPDEPLPAAAIAILIPPPPGIGPTTAPISLSTPNSPPPPGLVGEAPVQPILEATGIVPLNSLMPRVSSTEVVAMKPFSDGGAEIAVQQIGRVLSGQALAEGRGLAAVVGSVLDRLAIDLRPPAAAAAIGPAAVDAPPDIPPEEVPADEQRRTSSGGAVQTGILVLAALMVTRWRNDRRLSSLRNRTAAASRRP
jgi:hypothetical protein